MNRLVLVLVLVSVASGVAFVVSRQKSPDSPAPAAAEPPDQEADVQPEPAPPRVPAAARSVPRSRSQAAATSSPAAQPSAADTTPDFKSAIEQLLAPQTTYQEKQAWWKQLRESGGLEQLIAELEQRAARNPDAAEYPAALGQAYIQKIAAQKIAGTGDPRDYAILGMKADQSFDAALVLDPSNWEAKFSKAYSMTYWPAELGKGTEVMQRFGALIQQQEALPARPEFAQSYLLLGEQYRKAGRADYARQVWQRGASLFPDHPELQRKLTAPR